MNSAKILLLDIDGVLCVLSDCNGRDKHGQNFSTKCVDNLRRIIDYTNADIVVSSTWRIYGDMYELWRDRNLPGKIVGITPQIRDNTAKWSGTYVDQRRGKEIEQYLNMVQFTGKYCIIDDDEDMLQEQFKFFVKTETSVGLTKTLANRAIAILNK